MADDITYEYRRHIYEPERVGLDQSRRGRAPRPTRAPFEVARSDTPATDEQVFHALQAAWNEFTMQGPATKKAVCVVLAQWGVENLRWDGLRQLESGRPQGQQTGSAVAHRMFTPDDMPERQAEGLVARQAKLRPDDPLAFFKEDKRLAAPGKLRVWEIACFRFLDSLEKGAAFFLGVIGGKFAKALPYVNAGEPEQLR
jgi:hypothetical protein